MKLYSREVLKVNYVDLIHRFEEKIIFLNTSVTPLDMEARKELKYLVEVLKSKKEELNDLYGDLHNTDKNWIDFERGANYMYMRAIWQLEAVNNKLIN